MEYFAGFLLFIFIYLFVNIIIDFRKKFMLKYSILYSSCVEWKVVANKLVFIIKNSYRNYLDSNLRALSAYTYIYKHVCVCVCLSVY